MSDREENSKAIGDAIAEYGAARVRQAQAFEALESPRAVIGLIDKTHDALKTLWDAIEKARGDG